MIARHVVGDEGDTAASEREVQHQLRLVGGQWSVDVEGEGELFTPTHELHLQIFPLGRR